jgi:hypothetical protein
MLGEAKEEEIIRTIAAHKEEGGGLLTMVEAFEINSAEDYDAISEILKDIKTQFKQIEKERKAVTDPLNAVIKKVNGWFKPTKDDFTKIEKAIKRKMADYQLSQKQKQTEALEQAVEQGDARFLQKASSLQMPKVQGISNRVVWKFEIEDESLLPREFLMPDERAIAQVVNEQQGDTKIPGVKVIKDVQIGARSR